MLVQRKAPKCKLSAYCEVPLIDGLGYECAFTRGLHASRPGVRLRDLVRQLVGIEYGEPCNCGVLR